MYAVQVGDTCKEAVAAIGTVVAPTFQFAPLGNVFDGLQGFSRHAGEYGEVFFSFKDTSLIAESRCGGPGISFLLPGSVHFARFAVVGCGIAYDIAFAVYASVGCAHYYFGLTVIVQIVNHKLGVMGTGTDVLSEIDAPQLFAVQAVTIYQNFAGIAVVGVVVRVARVPFQDDFIFSISVYIAYGSIIGRINVGISRRSDTVCRLLHRYLDIACRGIGGQGITAVLAIGFFSFHNRTHFVSCSVRACIGVVIKRSGIYRFGSYLFAITIYVEPGIHGVGREVSPRYGDGRRILADSNHTTSEVFALQFLVVIIGLSVQARGNQYRCN